MLVPVHKQDIVVVGHVQVVWLKRSTHISAGMQVVECYNYEYIYVHVVSRESKCLISSEIYDIVLLSVVKREQ